LFFYQQINQGDSERFYFFFGVLTPKSWQIFLAKELSTSE